MIAKTVGYPYRLRGPSQSQSDTGIIIPSPSYKLNSVGANITSSAVPMNGVGLRSYALQNRSGSTGVAGLGVRIPNRYWIGGKYTDATTTYADDTTDAQDAGTADFVLETTTNNDGCIVAARCPFNAISIDVGTASAGGTPVRVLHYSNAAGTGWTALTNYLILTGAGANLSATGTTIANEALVVFAPPSDWGVVTALSTDLPAGYYALRIQATTAPSMTAGVADNLSIYYFPILLEGLADNQIASGSSHGYQMLASSTPQGELVGEGLFALFETANPQNLVTVDARAMG